MSTELPNGNMENRSTDIRETGFVGAEEMGPYWYMIGILQLAIGVALYYAGLAFRVWGVGLAFALVTYTIIVPLLDRILFVQLYTIGHFTFVDPQPNRPSLNLAKTTVRYATTCGNFLLSVMILVPAWTVLYRADVGGIKYVLLMMLAFATVKVLRHASVIAMKTPRPPWISLGATVIFTPLLIAWLVASGLWWFISRGPSLVESVAPIAITRRNERAKLNPTPWRVNGEQIRVAVALSGGGYRAALAHAGLLAALEEQHVPIDYLTTVSGGSIVGAAYSLGVPPSAFEKRLCESRPGLPNDLLSFCGVMREWIVPWSSNTKVYSDHFRRVLFEARTLEDLPERPLLLVNATDMESDGSEPREVFFKGRAPALRTDEGRNLDQSTSIADVVAASGAFPGAFQPMRLRWVADDSATMIKERKFVDGGILENLGLEGLRRYLTLSAGPNIPLPQRPHVLIISDATQYSGRLRVERKMELVRLLARSQNLSYDALHQQLYSRYTGRADFARWCRTEPPASQVSVVGYDAIDSRLANDVPRQLFMVVIPMTGATPSPNLAAFAKQYELEPNRPIAVVQQQVSAFDTLTELQPDEAKAAYWLGYSLGQIYAKTIESARVSAAQGL